MHRGKVHSHEGVNATRVVWLQEIAVSGNQQRKRCCTQVEHTTFYEVVEIRIKTQETAHAHKKSKVEVGEILLCNIEPLHGIADIGEEVFVFLF